MEAAVDVRDAEKCFEKKITFTGLNMYVPRGKIYALLGPSGCGKTTLLRCILGRLNLDKGSILVLGHPPGSKESGIPGPTVGYMAQETTVYLTMTIGEYLRYFGTILGVPFKEILAKSEYFIKLLRLPHKNTLASNLSGGQLKRLQFAAALIHDPKLLILDEPTVGIDVITKRCMWEYLVKMTTDLGTTIILTTHYIEEARIADRVGMIHDYTMAAEDDTATLLEKYGEDTLEDVFFKLCCNNPCAVVTNNDGQTYIDNMVTSHKLPSLDKGSEIQVLESRGFNQLTKKALKCTTQDRFGIDIVWHRIYAIMLRHFIILYRFPGVLLLLALLPSNQVFMFTQTMGNAIDGIKLTIVNEDAGPLGAQFLSQLNPKIIVQNPCHNYDAGFRAVVDGESHGILLIRSNFSAVFHRRFSEFALEGSEMVKAGTVDLQMDNTNLNMVKFAEFHLLEVFQHFVHQTLTLAGSNPYVSQMPINISQKSVEVISRPPSIYVLSGQSVQASFFSSLPMALIGIFMDKQRGYMEPNLIAGVNAAETFLGLMLVQLIVLVFQVIGVILSALPVLITINKGSLVLIFGLLYIQGVCGTSLGILLSLVCDQITMMFAIVSNIIFIAGTTSGAMWPIESMPVLFRYFSMCLPSTLSCRAVEVVIHRGWDLSYFAVWGAFGISFVWIFIFITFSFLVFYRKK